MRPKINLKSTIIFSTILAVTLNVVQFFGGMQQHKDAFSPPWAYADHTTTPSPAATPAKLSAIQPGSGPAALSATPPVGSQAASAPAPDATGVAARLLAAGLKPDYASLYLAVQQATGTPWQLLAAVHEVETGQSGSTSRSSSAGATGPMQFMPATFNHYALDGNGDGTKDISNISDAMFTAGRYLAAGGAAKGQYSSALYNYNHSWTYVSHVTGISSRLGL